MLRLKEKGLRGDDVGRKGGEVANVVGDVGDPGKKCGVAIVGDAEHGCEGELGGWIFELLF